MDMFIPDVVVPSRFEYEAWSKGMLVGQESASSRVSV